MDIQTIRREISRIESRYNGDNDLIPGAPIVTWADWSPLEIVKDLVDQVEDLQKTLADLGRNPSKN
jgi:hypothetical protein